MSVNFHIGDKTYKNILIKNLLFGGRHGIYYFKITKICIKFSGTEYKLKTKKHILFFIVFIRPRRIFRNLSLPDGVPELLKSKNPTKMPYVPTPPRPTKPFVTDMEYKGIKELNTFCRNPTRFKKVIVDIEQARVAIELKNSNTNSTRLKLEMVNSAGKGLSAVVSAAVVYVLLPEGEKKKLKEALEDVKSIFK